MGMQLHLQPQQDQHQPPHRLCVEDGGPPSEVPRLGNPNPPLPLLLHSQCLRRLTHRLRSRWSCHYPLQLPRLPEKLHSPRIQRESSDCPGSQLETLANLRRVPGRDHHPFRSALSGDVTCALSTKRKTKLHSSASAELLAQLKDTVEAWPS